MGQSLKKDKFCPEAKLKEFLNRAILITPNEIRNTPEGDKIMK